MNNQANCTWLPTPTCDGYWWQRFQDKVGKDNICYVWKNEDGRWLYRTPHIQSYTFEIKDPNMIWQGPLVPSSKPASAERLVHALRKRLKERIAKAAANVTAHVAAKEYGLAHANVILRNTMEDALRALDEVCQESQEFCHLQRPPHER